MADVPIDCEFPVWGLMPKKETNVVSFLNKYPAYDGRDTVIVIFDSGVDPAACGLKLTSTGETKVIERFDCSGCGDVDTTTVIKQLTDGCITGVTGRKLKIPTSWENPSGEWRVGIVYPFSLYPTKLRERVQEHRKTMLWDTPHKTAFASANKQFQDFDSQHAAAATLAPEDKLMKEELESRVDALQNADKKYTDVGPTYDCVLFHDGTVWRACIDTTEQGDLSSAPLLGEYSKTHEHTHLTDIDEMTVSINVHGNGDTLEIVGMCSTHGTHVAAIAAGYFPDEPDRNGVAPGAKIVSLTIGDSRLGSMETGAALVRACIKVMELSKVMRIDVINMSYGEHASWSDSGRIGEIMCEVVTRYGVSWVVSAGNHGPALCTVGAPPDIQKPLLIGVGAYVSPEMMSAAYSMRARLAGGPYSWSSRGPAADGAAGVSVCAPGGAVTSVARFTLRNAQLMNGTSMAAPHVAGALAILISGLKARSVPYSPYSIKRAVENSATWLTHVEPWAQGCGLLHVEHAFEWLTLYHAQPESDVAFGVQCGPRNGKGVLLRPRLDDVAKDVGITVEPQFLLDHKDVETEVIILNAMKDVSQKRRSYIEAQSMISRDKEVIGKQINFGMRLLLTCDSSWVSIPSYLDMMNVSRPFSIRVDTTSLVPGPHFTSILAYDVACVEKGPVFRIPITVLQPEPLKMTGPNSPVLSRTNVLFKPSTIQRHVVVPPAGATWAVLRLRTDERDKTGRYLVHAMQLIPRRSCRANESQKLLSVTADDVTAWPFKVYGGVTLEIAIAKYWANIGDMLMDYTIEFHGIRPDFGECLTFHSAEGLQEVIVSALRMEEVAPSVQIKYSEPVLRPTESKITPLTSRDIIPPSRQIYQLVNTYTFHLAKACEISPAVSVLSDMLYESEFESQMWMVYNSCKQLMSVGDAYPGKYSAKLEKGDYVIRMQARHDQKALLERLQELPILLQQKLPQQLTLDVYGSQSQAIVGGKKFTGASLVNGNLLPLFFTPLPSDKIVKPNSSLGLSLTGTISFAKDELGRRVDTSRFRYVVSELPKKLNSAAGKDKEKEKGYEGYVEALKEFKTCWLGKLEGEKLDELYEDLSKSSPSCLAAHIAYLHSIDPPSDPKRLPHACTPADVTVAWCENIIAVSQKVLDEIDKDKLLAFFGMKNDSRSDAAKIKQDYEKQKTQLIEALCRKGTAICRLHSLAAESDKDKYRQQAIDNMHELLMFTDCTDSKVLHYGVWHHFALGHWGRAVKLLHRVAEERPSREIDERLAEAYQQLRWDYLADFTTRSLPVKYPAGYRLF